MDLGKKLVEMSYQIIYNSIMIPAKAEKNIQAVDQTLNTEKITGCPRTIFKKGKIVPFF